MKRRRGHARIVKRVTRAVARIVMDAQAGRSIDTTWNSDAVRAAEMGLIVWDGAEWRPSDAGFVAIAEEERKRAHDRAVARRGAKGRYEAMTGVGMRRSRYGGWE